jgi:hypothetical protein
MFKLFLNMKDDIGNKVSNHIVFRCNDIVTAVPVHTSHFVPTVGIRKVLNEETKLLVKLKAFF